MASPRSDTFTPKRRESSSRFASLTPARVSISAPSVETFWVVLSPATADPRSLTAASLGGHGDMQFAEVLVGHWAGSSFKECAGGGRLGIRDDVAERRRAGEHH